MHSASSAFSIHQHLFVKYGLPLDSFNYVDSLMVATARTEMSCVSECLTRRYAPRFTTDNANNGDFLCQEITFFRAKTLPLSRTLESLLASSAISAVDSSPISVPELRAKNPIQSDNRRGNGAYPGESGDVQSLVNRVTERETSCSVLGVFEDFCALICYDRDIPHNFRR